jgi:hypothetical protein
MIVLDEQHLTSVLTEFVAITTRTDRIEHLHCSRRN